MFFAALSKFEKLILGWPSIENTEKIAEQQGPIPPVKILEFHRSSLSGGFSDVNHNSHAFGSSETNSFGVREPRYVPFDGVSWISRFPVIG